MLDGVDIGTLDGVPVQRVRWRTTVRVVGQRWYGAGSVLVLGCAASLLSPIGADSLGFRVALLVCAVPFVMWLVASARKSFTGDQLGRAGPRRTWEAALRRGVRRPAVLLLRDRVVVLHDEQGDLVIGPCRLVVSRRMNLIGVQLSESPSLLPLPVFGRRIDIRRVVLAQPDHSDR